MNTAHDFPGTSSITPSSENCRYKYIIFFLLLTILSSALSACGHKVVAIPSLASDTRIHHKNSDDSEEITREEAVLIALNAASVTEIEITLLNIEEAVYKHEEIFKVKFSVLSKLYTCIIRRNDGTVLEQSVSISPSLLFSHKIL